jgi:hypothetical protein
LPPTRPPPRVPARASSRRARLARPGRVLVPGRFAAHIGSSEDADPAGADEQTDDDEHDAERGEGRLARDPNAPGLKRSTRSLTSISPRRATVAEANDRPAIRDHRVSTSVAPRLPATRRADRAGFARFGAPSRTATASTVLRSLCSLSVLGRRPWLGRRPVARDRWPTP